MCFKTPCNKCGKTTWGGCGQHIKSALAGVPESDWCTCSDKHVSETMKS